MTALQQRPGGLALLCCFALLLPLLAHGADIPLGSTLSPGNSASWTSPNNTFSLSFTPSPTSPSLFVATITYAGGVPVWSAGDGAAVDSGGSLRLSSTGDLQLVNGSGAVLWSSNTGGRGVTAAAVEESGNLVLKNSKTTLWRSFDHPTDTVVMSQNFTSRMNLTSGSYVFSVDNAGNLTLKWTRGANTAVTYFNKVYTTSFTGEHVTLSSPTLTIQTNGLVLLTDRRLTSSPILVAYSSNYGESGDMLRFLRLDADGNLRAYSAARGSNAAAEQWSAVADQCQVFGYCGNMGVCSYNGTSPVCGCPSQNFQLSNPSNPRDGCKRKVDLQNCPGNTTMLQLDNTQFLTYPPEIIVEQFFVGITACRLNCLAGGSCVASTALSDGSGLCWLKVSNFVSAYTSPALPSTSFVKVANDFQAKDNSFSLAIIRIALPKWLAHGSVRDRERESHSSRRSSFYINGLPGVSTSNPLTCRLRSRRGACVLRFRSPSPSCYLRQDDHVDDVGDSPGIPGLGGVSGLAEQGRQRVAADGGDAGGAAELPWSGGALRRRGEEEVGRQLGLHGALRLRRRLDLLGHLGLQHVLRRQADPHLGQGPARAQPGLPHRPGRPAGDGALPRRRRRPGDRRRGALLPDGDGGVLPVRVRRHHADPDRRVAAGADELPGVDDLRPALAHLLLHHRRLLRLGRRIPLPVGRHRLLRRLRHPPLRRLRRVHRRILGGPSGAERPGEVPAQQHPVHPHRRRTAVDGVGRVQRRWPLRRQLGGVHVGGEHQHLHGHEPHRLDLPRRHLLRQALRHRRRPGHDHRPGLHHARRRCGSGLGGAGDGGARRQHPVVHDDDPAQAVEVPEARGRHPGRHPHARRGGSPRWPADGTPRGPHPVQPLPPRDQLPGRLLRRHRRRAVREAAGRRALRHRLERGRHVGHLRRHQCRRPAAHARGQARGRRRRRARRGGLRALGRRRALRRHQARRRRDRARRTRRRRARIADPQLKTLSLHVRCIIMYIARRSC